MVAEYINQDISGGQIPVDNIFASQMKHSLGGSFNNLEFLLVAQFFRL